MLPLLCESLCWVQGPGQRERRKRSVVVRWVCGWSPLGLYFFHPAIHAPPRPQSMVKDGVFEVKPASLRSEEHTSELQSRFDLVCRLLLEKKKKYNTQY